MRLRPLVSTALVTTAVALTACGGDSDEDQIRSAVTDFTEAVQDKDAGKLCSSVVTERIPDGEKCEDQVSGDEFESIGKLEDIKVTDIKVKGDTATAQVAATVDGKESKDDGTFKKVDGDWKLALDE
jgi:ketosteroid isomerase-like protein